ncbi:unnamed protein product [Cochlearia groenlandica]
MITGALRRSSLTSRQTLSAALTSVDSCLTQHFTSAATKTNLIRNGSNHSSNTASDINIRSEPSLGFTARIAIQGYATKSKSVSKVRISPPENVKPLLNRKAIALLQKEAEESTSKIKGTKICIAIRSFDNPEKQAWCLPPHTRKIAMPDTRVLYTVLRSPHVDKKSREQFEMRFKKRLLVIKAQSHELSKKLFWLKRYRILGAQYELQFHCKTRLDMNPVLDNIHGVSTIGQ